MSRSYGRVAPGRTMDRGWHKVMRARERQCIIREMQNAEYGDVIFPIVSEVSDPWGGDNGNYLYFKKEIREGYFKEIRNILNGYTSTDRWSDEDSTEYFLDCFNRIRGIVHSDRSRFSLEWLNLKEAKLVIKKWTGEPIDVLYYLTRFRIIEKAVNHEFFLRNRK
jgi:hypothetical protein